MEEHVLPGMVEFKAGTNPGRGYLALPTHPKGAVLVLHAWWGLNDFFKGLCDRLASQGYAALAPDLRNGAVATTVEEAEDLMKRSSNDLSKNAVLGAVDYLRSLPTVDGRKIGAIGFSMGGGWALWLSVQRAEDVAAVVMFYSTEYPEKGDYTKTRASYLGHYAPEDEWEPIDGVRAFESQLRASGRDVEFHFYPGTKHWFFEENRPLEYNRDAAGLAWNRTLDFLNSKLR
jgi:carboxymethylenebutenolidase